MSDFKMIDYPIIASITVTLKLENAKLQLQFGKYEMLLDSSLNEFVKT